MELLFLRKIAFFVWSTLFVFLLIVGCQKDVKMDIPGYEEKLVVDGRIETGLPPFILLTTNRNIFEENSLDSLFGSYISDAVITISDGTNFDTLQTICSTDIPEGYEDLGAYVFGIPSYLLKKFKFCAYSTLNPIFFGKENTNYTITIHYKQKKYSATTTIPKSILLDTVYWKPEKSTPDFGFAYAKLTDPSTIGNAYFWEVLRIKRGENGQNLDTRFYRPRNPAFEDQFFNGKSFDFWYENPRTNFDNSLPENEQGLYKRGDSIMIKFSTITTQSFNYYRSKYSQMNSGGSPFASPINLPSNVTGGALGVFSGFATSYQLLICNDK
jgi:hypothetical protein